MDFADTLLSGRDYRSSDHVECEKLVLCWVNWDMESLDCSEDWDLFYEVIVDYFGFSGTLYRGLQLNYGGELSESSYASFSKDEEVARMFAGYSEVHGSNNRIEGDHVLIKSYVKDAFDIDLLLDYLAPVTDNDDLYEHVEHNKWEREVIGPFRFNGIVETEFIEVPEGSSGSGW